MLFKNLVIYRLPSDWNVSAAELEDALTRRPLQPCGPLDMESRGWVPASPANRIVHTTNGQHLVALGIYQKILPGAVIKEETKERAKALEQEQGFAVGRKQLRDLKDKVTAELRAKAFVRKKILRAWIDPANGWLVVEAAGASSAEKLVETLRDCLGSLAVQLLDTQHSPQQGMAAWISQGEAPLRLTLDTDLELQAADESKSTVRYARHSLEGKDILTHISTGKSVTKLGLTWNDRVTFVLTNKLEVKRVKFLSIESKDAGESESGLSESEQFDADFTLMSGELAQVLADLTAALGGEPQQQEQALAA
jgi:recombination associated protein RdgC